MQRKPQIIYFSLAVPLIVLLLSVANLITKGYLYSQMSLLGGSVFPKGEVWRIVTYPLTFNNISELFLLLAVFPFISYRIESILKTRLYGVFLTLVTWIFGLGMVSFFNKSSIPFTGLEMVSCMILVFYTLFRPKETIYKLIPNFKVWMYSGIVFSFWTILNLFIFKRYGTAGMILPLTSFIVGCSSGLTAYVLVKHKANKQNREILALKVASSEHIDKFMEMAYINEKKNTNYVNSESEPNYTLLRENASENEERLNDILDKINLYGKEGLDTKEIKFLNELSKHLE
jgi:membrane associated rhomboid family serine protease